MKGDLEEAKKSLAKVRTGCIEKEIITLEGNVKSYIASRGGIRDIIKVKSHRKAAGVTMSLMVIQQTTAMSVMTFYLQFVFESANSTISPEIASIIIGVVQLFGSLASTITVDKLGRRPLLLASTIATSSSLFVLSIYFYLLVTMGDVSSIGWLPLATLIIYRIAYGLGIGSLPQTLLSEIFPAHVKSVASALTVCTCHSCFFIVSKLFPILVSAVDNWFAFLFFAICNTAGVVFVWFVVPETKGRTLDEIVKSFE
ncbi:Sugar transporter [Popillia japonica]|uniref:Sugar transporter n=1 Tax=Popillia japonica TaxID=7064 RepID=A0AAW1JLJ9_POPJA